MIPWWGAVLISVASAVGYNFTKGFWSAMRRKRSIAWSCPHCVFGVTVRDTPRSEDAQQVVDELALAHLDGFHDDWKERL